jgi:hypothetical protein
MRGRVERLLRNHLLETVRQAEVGKGHLRSLAALEGEDTPLSKRSAARPRDWALYLSRGCGSQRVI